MLKGILNNTRILRKIRKLIFSYYYVDLRLIEPTDRKKHFDFITEFRNEFFKDNPVERDKRIDFPINSDTDICFVAWHRESHRIVGIILLKKSTQQNLKAWQVKGVAVLKEFRSKGIGERLLRKAIFLAKSENLAIFLDALETNKPAISLYEKLGFKATNEKERFQVDGVEYPSSQLVMVRDA
ncbi:MAG: GNAT family N-acetyltransferase [Candidatus Omnitrophota bacterium]